MNGPASEDFAAIQNLYDVDMAANATIQDLVFPRVFGPGEYIGQFSDNSASELRAMGEAMALPAGARVLDIGCGRGAVARFLSGCLGWRVTGIDLSAVPLRHGHAGADGAVVSLIHGNVYEYALPPGFDGAYGTGSFCHFDAARLFARCRQVLRPGGVLAFMERVRIGSIAPDDWRRLTTEWHCPFVYSVDEYRELLHAHGFAPRTVLDLTASFRSWQRKSVEVRQQLADEIIARTSRELYETSLRLAAYENDVTEAGQLGYAMIIAQHDEDQL